MLKEHKIARFVSLVIVCFAALPFCTSAVHAADMGTAFSYQGKLVRNGTPVTNSCSFTFGLFDALTVGTQQGNSPKAALGVAVANGLFTVTLDFGENAFNGDARWIEISVFCSGDASATTLIPRVELTPVPHALALPGMRTPQNGVTPNVIGGSSFNAVAPNVVAATIAGGGVQGIYADDGIPVFVEYEHHLYDDFCTIGGGGKNQAGSNDTIVVNDRYATVSGGFSNNANSEYSTISGGSFNDVDGWNSTICGGRENLVSGSYSTIAGGWDNWAGAYNSTVGGGSENFANGVDSTISGGLSNVADSPAAFVGGGDSNWATDAYATVGGGTLNIANGLSATVAGGYSNIANGGYGSIGGGYANTANGAQSTVAGGYANVAWGPYSIIPGGAFCRAGGNYSFAAGRQAKVRDASTVGGGDTDGDQGTFVWADSTASDFISTGPNQFLIRASGGVGIGTNIPSDNLDVTYSLRASRIGVSSQFVQLSSPGAGGNFVTGRSSGSNRKYLGIGSVHNGIGTPAGNTGIYFYVGDEAAPTNVMYITDNSRVGIGDESPEVELDVIGSISYTGTITDVSDERLKENIAPLSNALGKIAGLRGVYFNMKDTPDQRDVGLIAQDVQAVLPEAVRLIDSEHGYMGVSYPSVIPLLVEAVKETWDSTSAAQSYNECSIRELHALHDEKNHQIDQLNNELADLRNLVHSLIAEKDGAE